MNQPAEIVPNNTTFEIDSTSTVPPITKLNPLQNLFRRLRKSEKARRNTRGAFGGGKRSARHAGLV